MGARQGFCESHAPRQNTSHGFIFSKAVILTSFNSIPPVTTPGSNTKSLFQTRTCHALTLSRLGSFALTKLAAASVARNRSLLLLLLSIFRTSVHLESQAFSAPPLRRRIAHMLAVQRPEMASPPQQSSSGASLPFGCMLYTPSSSFPLSAPLSVTCTRPCLRHLSIAVSPRE